MRFLGVGDCADLAALYLRLAEDGHEVKVFIGHPLCQDTLSGLIDRVTNWEAELDWVRAAGGDGCILFENVGAGRGALQDRLRRDGLNVIGSSAYGTRLENDRAYAQQILAELGLSTAAVFEFSDANEAKRFIDRRPARYVLKSNGPDAPSFVGRHSTGRDVRALLESGAKAAGSSFILMDFVDGIEMGVGAYFNGADFLGPACLDCADSLSARLLEKAHERPLDPAEPFAHAAAQQRGLELARLIGFDHARVDVTRPRHAPRVDEDPARLVNRRYDGFLAQPLALVPVVLGENGECRSRGAEGSKVLG